MPQLKLFEPTDPPAELPLTVLDVITSYLRHSQATGLHGPEAFDERRRTLGWFVEVFGDLAVADAKPFHLSEWIESNERWRSVSTRRAKANVVRAAFQWAYKEERIDRNPFSKVRYAEAERRPELLDDDLSKISALSSKHFERAVKWLRLTGCRLSELCEARWCDIDFDRAVWTVHKHKSKRYTQRPKMVALVPDAIQLLAFLICLASAPGTAAPTTTAAMKAFPVTTSTDIIFRNSRGTQWNRRTLGQTLRRIKERHGIEIKATLHGIRHQALSAAINAGASIKMIAEQAGHSTTVVTERFYHHRSDAQIEAMRAAMQAGLPKE